MGKLLEFKLKPKTKNHTPQVTAAESSVQHLRSTMHSLNSTEARMEFIMIIVSQLCLWTVKSGHYDDPKARMLAWVTKKLTDFTTLKKEG